MVACMENWAGGYPAGITTAGNGRSFPLTLHLVFTKKQELSRMKYLNAEAVLPEPLLELVRLYAEGELLYIPKRSQSRRLWGEATGSREMIKARNEAIFEAFQNGGEIAALAREYSLSEETVKKIVYKKK